MLILRIALLCRNIKILMNGGKEEMDVIFLCVCALTTAFRR
jgi:hypothetical protein